jgi:hypothetical protein
MILENHENKTQHMWQWATAMAARFHQGQMGKDGKTPYIAHA